MGIVLKAGSPPSGSPLQDQAKTLAPESVNNRASAKSGTPPCMADLSRIPGPAVFPLWDLYPKAGSVGTCFHLASALAGPWSGTIKRGAGGLRLAEIYFG